MLGRCMSLGGTLRFPASSLGAGRSLKRPRSLLSHHHGRALCSIKRGRLHQRQQREQPQSDAVAIIGAGPAGLTLSALLSKFGVPSILLERSPALPTHPQAHFINLRSMEILRHAFGGLDRRVLEMCPPREEWRYGCVCQSAINAGAFVNHGRHEFFYDSIRWQSCSKHVYLCRFDDTAVFFSRLWPLGFSHQPVSVCSPLIYGRTSSSYLRSSET